MRTKTPRIAFIRIRNRRKNSLALPRWFLYNFVTTKKCRLRRDLVKRQKLKHHDGMSESNKIIQLLEQAIGLLKNTKEEPEKDFPTVDEIAEMDQGAVKELASSVGLSSDKTKMLRKHLTVIAQVGADSTDDLELADVQAVLTSLGIEPSKKLQSCIDQVKNYFEADGGAEKPAEKESADEDSEEEEADEEAKESTEEDDEEDEEEEEEEEEETEEEEEEEETPPVKGKKSVPSKSAEDDEEEDDEEDEEDEEEEEEEEEEDEDEDEDEDDEDSEEESASDVVAKVKKFPKDSVMKSRLDAYNAATKSKIKIGKDLKAAYKLLLEKMVSKGQVIEWGEPYINGSEGCCCGLPLKDVKVGGKEAGKCLVTGKVFVQDEDGDLVEME